MKNLSFATIMAAAMFLLIPGMASAQAHGHGGNFGRGPAIHQGGGQFNGGQFNGGHYNGGHFNGGVPNRGYDGRFDGRVNGRFDGRVNGRIDGRFYNRGYDERFYGRGFVRGDYGRDYRGVWRGLPFAGGFGYRGWYGCYGGVWGFYGPQYIPAYGMPSITVYEQVPQTAYDPYTGQYVQTGGVMTVVHVAVWNSYYGAYTYTDSYGQLQIVR